MADFWYTVVFLTGVRHHSCMGFLKNLLAVTSKPLENKVVLFDQDWEESWNSLRDYSEHTSGNFSVSVSFDTDLLQNFWDSIESHEPRPQILYSTNQQAINNVGESYRQNEIAAFCENLPGEKMPWLAGFLLPEMANPNDKTAVAVYVIKPRKTGGDEPPFDILHAGYMDRESAHKVHRKLLNLMGKNLFIPLLIRITGGTQEKPNYGVVPYAMTDSIKFP